MKRVLLIVAVGSLVVAASADGKGLRWVELCGPSDCRRTPGRQIEGDVLIFPPWVMSGAPDDPPARAGRWLQVRVATARSRRIMRSVVMPGIGYAGGDQGGGYGFVWERLGREARATYRRLGRGIEPYPAAMAPDIAATSFAATGSAMRPVALTVAAAVDRIVTGLRG